MSLGLYIESKTPVLHRGTGVYIRKDGETRELATKQEVLTYFPDANPDEINETTYEDDEYFHLNLTHNLTEMAGKCTILGSCSTKVTGELSLYDLMWHPEENLGITKPTLGYITDLMECYKKLLQKPEYFKQFNPENGWGSYDQLLKGVKGYLSALQSIPDDLENYTIVAYT